MMNEKPYLTLKFWMALVSIGVLVGTAAGLFTEEQGEGFKLLIEPLIAATLALVAYILSVAYVRANAVRRGLLPTGERPKWLQHQFWMALIGYASLVLVGIGAIDETTAGELVALLNPFVLAVLPVIALLFGYSYEEAAALR